MLPHIEINYLAVLAATLAQFFLGWIWFGPLFGRAWATEMGMSMDNPPPKSVMVQGMLLSFVGSLLTAYILAHFSLVWRPSVWGAGMDAPDYLYGIKAALFIWIGFYIPQDLGAVAWGGKSWKLFGINTTNHALSLLAAGLILAYWR